MSAGLYRKYNVTRTDGSDNPDGKHYQCNYFVLDMTHDPHAISALRAYAKSCRSSYPNLASDLDAIVDGNTLMQERASL